MKDFGGCIGLATSLSQNHVAAGFSLRFPRTRKGCSYKNPGYEDGL
jgi:hypothetical protein